MHREQRLQRLASLDLQASFAQVIHKHAHQHREFTVTIWISRGLDQVAGTSRLGWVEHRLQVAVRVIKALDVGISRLLCISRLRRFIFDSLGTGIPCGLLSTTDAQN